ncbi:type IV pilus twitching motility protein PilT [Aureibacillus halotolerans]|uniref:Twitching motility protein PilT n=1 Tax=Aureibacillus halotolerans TaxID=1508390 RepID=A0A4V3D540_9BACI|nr:type IV pilus twitching motility protein PilT [Aureibacillus halotolerans]TDQ38287.1 twitching motility protein PilT [Aureibacillus halotolerans]
MKTYIEELLVEAFEKGASDLHLTVGVPPMFRINGELVPSQKDGMQARETEDMCDALLDDGQRDTLKRQGELDFSYSVFGVSRFRMNVYKQRSCYCLAARVIPSHIPSIEELGLPSVLKRIIRQPQGLVLVTGPTGSGKSTTLAAMIHEINQHEARHIITLEDPIEYLHKHQRSIIHQREVGFDTTNFKAGLRSCLRQDPDIILVGELRDLETISTAITAAETGHLVLGTLHTTDAASTIDRIIDVFSSDQQRQIRIQLASVLTAVASQRLFKTKDGKGRRAAVEMLINTPAIANLIRNEKIHQIQNVLQTSKAQGMQTLDMAVNELMQQGLIQHDDMRMASRERAF